MFNRSLGRGLAAAGALALFVCLPSAIIEEARAELYGGGSFTMQQCTAALLFGGGNAGITYVGTPTCWWYNRGGPFTYVYINMQLSSKGRSTGAATISGLPLVVAYQDRLQVVSFSNIAPGSDGDIAATASGSTITLWKGAPNSGVTAKLADADFQNNSQIIISGFYQSTNQ